MDHEEQDTTTTTPPEPRTRTAAAPTATATPEVLADRQRIIAIRSLVSHHGLGDEFGDALIERGTPLERVRELVLDRLAARSESFPPSPNANHRAPDVGDGTPIMPGDDGREDFHRAAIDSILIRSGIHVEKPHAAARDVSASVHDLARICLSRAGKGGSRWFGGEARGSELLKRAMTTSDFPLVLSGALHASVRKGYEDEPASHRAWVRAVPVPDFRDQERPILGSAPELEKVRERGEYKHGSLTEDSTKYRVEKFGRIVSLSWEVLVNDNLGAFLRVQPALGQAARRKEADLVYAMFAENAGAGPTMQDTVALFHAATHGNLTDAAALSADLLAVGRTLLRKQTAVGGGHLSLVPRFWLVAPEYETAAEVILANASRRMTSEKSTAEWIASLELVVEPRLAETATYLAADSGQIDTVELGLLGDLNGPKIEEEQEFKKDVFLWKVTHVFGAKALDWRGLVRMPISG